MKVTSLAVVALAMLVSVRSAHASTIPFSDTFNPADVLINNTSNLCLGTNGVSDTTDATSAGCNTLSWTHFVTGFNSLTDAINYPASFTLTLYDDDADDGEEGYDVTFDLASGSATLGFSGTTPLNISLNVTANLGDGSMTVVLSEKSNADAKDFFFDRSVLAGSFERPAVSTDVVPEPTTLLLIGTGVAGLGARWRARSRSILG